MSKCDCKYCLHISGKGPLPQPTKHERFISQMEDALLEVPRDVPQSYLDGPFAMGKDGTMWSTGMNTDLQENDSWMLSEGYKSTYFKIDKHGTISGIPHNEVPMPDCEPPKSSAPSPWMLDGIFTVALITSIVAATSGLAYCIVNTLKQVLIL